jgi:hypothetical protein
MDSFHQSVVDVRKSVIWDLATMVCLKLSDDKHTLPSAIALVLLMFWERYLRHLL